jgi:DNA-binding MarR family transcriptional regulator
MEESGLVTRERSTTDRRLVTTRITKKGRQIVDSLDEAADDQHEKALGHMNEEQLRTLIRLLELARNKE